MGRRYRTSTSRTLSPRPAASSRATYIPAGASIPEPSRPSQLFVCSPALARPRANSRTRRPARSYTTSHASASAGNAQRSVAPPRAGFAEASDSESTAGAGSSTHMVAVLFELQANAKLSHVPYKGSGPALVDLIGGQIAMMFENLSSSIGHVRSGKLRALAVTTARREPKLPDVPTLAELGITGFEEVPYYGLFAPAGTPRAALEPISAALAKALAQPTVRDRLTAMGLAVGFMSGEQLAQRERAYTEVWARIIRDSGFQPQ